MTSIPISDFSPAKELRRSESEEAALSPHSSASPNDSQEAPIQPLIDDEFESPEGHHFRGASFGNESESDTYQESNFDRLVTSYEQSLARQASLDQQLEEMHRAHAVQYDMWEGRYKRTCIELERSSQRVEELKELLEAKEAENSRLLQDLDTLRTEIKEYRQADTQSKSIIQQLQQELVYKDQLAKEQSSKFEELLRNFSPKAKKTARTVSKSPTPGSQHHSESPCFASNAGKYSGVYLLQSAVKCR